VNFVQISQRIEITFWNKVIDILNDPRSLRVISAILVVMIIFSVVTLSFVIIAQINPVLASNSEETAFSIAPTQPGKLIEKHQVNTLVILVDELSSTNEVGAVELQDIWLAVYLTKPSKMMLMPLNVAVEDFNRQEYILTTNGTLDRSFIRNLQSTGIWWDHFLIIDSNIDPIIFERNFSSQVSSTHEVDPVKAAYYHAALANFLCQMTVKLHRSGDAQNVFEGIDGHYKTDLGLSSIMADKEHDADKAIRITCEFPTLIEMVQE
jgi:hypothetical protein